MQMLTDNMHDYSVMEEKYQPEIKCNRYPHMTNVGYTAGSSYQPVVNGFSSTGAALPLQKTFLLPQHQQQQQQQQPFPFWFPMPAQPLHFSPQLPLTFRHPLPQQPYWYPRMPPPKVGYFAGGMPHQMASTSVPLQQPNPPVTTATATVENGKYDGDDSMVDVVNGDNNNTAMCTTLATVDDDTLPTLAPQAPTRNRANMARNRQYTITALKIGSFEMRSPEKFTKNKLRLISNIRQMIYDFSYDYLLSDESEPIKLLVTVTVPLESIINVSFCGKEATFRLCESARLATCVDKNQYPSEQRKHLLGVKTVDITNGQLGCTQHTVTLLRPFGVMFKKFFTDYNAYFEHRIFSVSRSPVICANLVSTIDRVAAVDDSSNRRQIALRKSSASIGATLAQRRIFEDITHRNRRKSSKPVKNMKNVTSSLSENQSGKGQFVLRSYLKTLPPASDPIIVDLSSDRDDEELNVEKEVRRINNGKFVAKIE